MRFSPPSRKRISDVFLTPREPQRVFALLWLILTLAAIVPLFLFDPEQSRVFPPCPWHALTGLECPGCGSTRALHHLLHLRLSAAIGLNPLLLLYAPLLLRALASNTAHVFRGQPFKPLRLAPTWIWLLLGVTLAFWVIRNTSLWP